MKRLYPGHVPTSAPQKVLLAASSAVLGFIDPRRVEHVARLGEVTAGPFLGRLRDHMSRHDEGRRVLAERPSWKRWVQVDELAQMEAGSLGHAYASFMNQNDLDPRCRPPVRYVDDAELAFVMERYRDVHDLLHVVLGFEEVTVAAEVALKVAEAQITGLPMNALAALVGPLRLSWAEQRNLVAKTLPWALKNATSDLMCLYWEERVDQSLDDLREELGITRARF